MSKAGPTDPRRGRGQGGYSYISLLIVLVALAMAAQTPWIPSSTTARRMAEQELVFQGRAYRDAIRSYWELVPADPSFPATLEDLLDDPRRPGVRHIRRLYAPSIGGEWEAIRGAGGGIAGVRPDSEETSMKQSGFAPDLQIEEPAETYRDWTFTFDPDATPG